MILPSTEHFKFKDGIIGGDEVILITPNDISCKWCEETLQFRSMIIRKSDHRIISRSFPKFFNWNEQPDIEKFPDGEFTAVEKMDGSLICWGIHNGELIHRTRGTFDAKNMPNGHEIEFLKTKYKTFISKIPARYAYTILTEWQTPTNIIVINAVSEPTLTLVGMIHNETGILVSQDALDELAKTFELKRPKTYNYSSMVELISNVLTWNDREGVVVYSSDYQRLRKIKSEWYCELHKLLGGMKSIGNVLDVFMVSSRSTNPEEFHKFIEQTLDHEIAEQCRKDINLLCAAYRIVTENIKTVELYVNDLDKTLSRRDLALDIIETFPDWRKTVDFLLLDGRPIDDNLLRSAIALHI